MILFSLYISFFIVIYIFHKKVVPFINTYVHNYNKKITTTLHNFDQERYALIKELTELNQEITLLPEKIDQIFQEGQQKMLNLKKAQSEALIDIFNNKKNITQYHIKTLQERSNQENRLKIAQNVENILILWTKEENWNEHFQDIITTKKLNHIAKARQ